MHKDSNQERFGGDLIAVIAEASGTTNHPCSFQMFFTEGDVVEYHPNESTPIPVIVMLTHTDTIIMLAYTDMINMIPDAYHYRSC